MVTVTLTIPDAKAARVNDAFASAYGWSETLTDGSPNPETKAQHTKRRLLEFARDVTLAEEAKAAAEAARNSTIDGFDITLS